MAGWLKVPLDKLAALVSQSAKFQEIVGAEDATEALTHIYKGAAPNDTETDADGQGGSIVTSMPRAIVTTFGNIKIDLTQARRAPRILGTYALEFHFLIPEAQQGDHNAAASWFSGAVETILEEIEAIANTPGNLRVNTIEEGVAMEVGDPIESGGVEWWGSGWMIEIPGF